MSRSVSDVIPVLEGARYLEQVLEAPDHVILRVRVAVLFERDPQAGALLDPLEDDRLEDVDRAGREARSSFELQLPRPVAPDEELVVPGKPEREGVPARGR